MRTGRPVVGTTLDRLFDRCRVEGSCWVWTGGMNSNGYGQISVAGRVELVHRVMADEVDLPGAGPLVLHRCDNPPCFNPAHLFRGTNEDNLRDAAAKGRLVSSARKVTMEQAEAMRQRYEAGKVSTAGLAREHGISQDSAWKIVRNINYTAPGRCPAGKETAHA